MTSRREFLTSLGAAGLGAAGLRATAGCTATGTGKLDAIGMQLYTVRSAMEESVERTLARVAQAGYDEVEFAGDFDRSPQEIRRALDDTGLRAPSTHLQVDLLERDWEATVDLAATIGHEYLVVPSMPPALRTALDGYRQAADRFNRLGEAARAAGLTFGYHNHDFEFAMLEGRRPYDVLLQETDPALVTLELDLYWITKAGGDPLAYFRDHAGRFALVHVKDMAADGAMADVGAGSIDFATLFSRSSQAGIRHYFVEHDHPADPFVSIATSYRYLHDLTF